MIDDVCRFQAMDQIGVKPIDSQKKLQHHI